MQEMENYFKTKAVMAKSQIWKSKFADYVSNFLTSRGPERLHLKRGYVLNLLAYTSVAGKPATVILYVF